MIPLAILETGEPPPGLERFGPYSQMFQRLLGAEVACTPFDVRRGVFPERLEAFAGALVTGSSAGVYDDLPWIEPLKAWLVEARPRTRLVGVCFGHQVMAEAFGGEVVKAPQGWGVGLARYDVRRREPWMDRADAIALPVSHQDQVVKLPPDARVIAASDFTPFGALAYGSSPAISFQQHPEFEPAFAAALLESRRGTRLVEAQADAAVASLAAPNDRARVAGWIRRFLETA